MTAVPGQRKTDMNKVQLLGWLESRMMYFREREKFCKSDDDIETAVRFNVRYQEASYIYDVIERGDFDVVETAVTDD